VNIGFRDITQQPPMDDLRHRMSASPTGRQLAVDGNLVVEIVDFDPNDASADITQIRPDGSEVLYIRSGTQERWSFTRETGWQQV